MNDQYIFIPKLKEYLDKPAIEREIEMERLEHERRVNMMQEDHARRVDDLWRDYRLSRQQLQEAHTRYLACLESLLESE